MWSSRRASAALAAAHVVRREGARQGRKWRKAQGLRTLYYPTPLPGGPRFHFSAVGQSHKSLFYKHLKGLAISSVTTILGAC